MGQNVCGRKSLKTSAQGDAFLPGKHSSLALWTQIFVTCALALMHTAGGVIYGFTGITLDRVTDPDSEDIFMDTQQVSIYTSIMVIGAFSGGWFFGPFSMKFGQRVSLLFGMPLAVAGWLISYFSHIYSLLLLSRFILGAFTTIAFSCSMTYITETVHPSIRGRLMALTDLARQIGYLYVYLVGSTSLNWRTVGLVCGLTPLAIPCIALLVIPSSPRWLALKNHSDKEIEHSLRYFRGEFYNVKEELSEIKKDVLKARDKSSFDQLKIIKEGTVAKKLVLLLYLIIAVNFSGNIVVNSYSVTIFEAAQTGISPYLSTVLCGVVRVIGCSLYILMADRIGRRPMAMVFLTLSALSIASLGVFFHLEYIGHDTSHVLWLPLVSTLLFILFTVLYNPVIQLMRSELLPNSIRNFGSNLVTSIYSLGTFLAVFTYPFIVMLTGEQWAFWIFSINSIMMTLVIFFFLPETSGKTLEEI